MRSEFFKMSLILIFASAVSGALADPVRADSSTTKGDSPTLHAESSISLSGSSTTPTAEHYLAMNAPRLLVHSNVTKRSYLIADASGRTDRKDGFMEPPKFSDEQLQRMMELRDQHRIATASQHAELAALSHKLSLLLTADSIDRKEVGSIQAKIDALRSELAKAHAKFTVDSAEILTPEQRQKLRHRLLLHQGRPGFGPGHGPGPIPGSHGDVLFGMPPMAGTAGVHVGGPVTHPFPGPPPFMAAAPFAVANAEPFDMPLPPGGCEGFFTEICPAPFTIPLGPPPMFTFGLMRGGPGHMVVPPPGSPHGGHAGPEGGVTQMGTPRRPPAPPPAPPSEPQADDERSSES